MSQLSNIPQGTALTTTSWQDPSNDFRLGDEVRNEGLDVLRKIWRRRWLVVGIAGAFVAVGVIAGQLMVPRYTAEARLLVGVPQPQVTKFEQVLKGLEPNSETVLSEAYVVASRDVARSVGYRLALDKSPAFNPYLEEQSWRDYLDPSKLLKALIPPAEGVSNDEPAQKAPPSDEQQKADQEALWQIIDARLLDRIEVTPLNRSYVIAIAAQAEEPDMAARIANTFADVYVERELVRKQRASDKANEWLQGRIKEVQKNAEESGRAVELYRREHGLLQTKSDTVIAQQLAALNGELVAAENAKAQADANLDQARGQLKNPTNVESLPAVLQSEIVRTLRGQQADLERQAAELSSSYTNKHPRIREIQAQINDINGKIKGEISKVVRALSHESQIAQDRVNRASSRMEKLKAEMGQANTQTVKLMELEREAQANNTMLETLLLRSKETVSQQDIAVPTADIISRANVPFGPSFPPKALIIVIAALVGTGAGVLIALLLENLDQTFRTGDEVEEYIGLPPLALVPAVKRRRPTPIEHVARKPYSTFTNSLRMFAARLTLGSSDGKMPKTMLFTSALPSEGKSRISTSFAQMLALDGQRVILLDLDWKKPGLHRMFKQSRGFGIADLLHGDITPEEAVYRDPLSGAHIMFAGNVGRLHGNTAWLERLRLLLQTLSRHYDVVILDSSPATVAPEVLYLARLVEHTIFVVKWASTPRRAVAGEIRNLLRVGARIDGIVLSQVDPKRYHKYGYDEEDGLRHRYLIHGAS
jgi:uncharacterized protein involved in exopolysaccharide biosynthesis/Mrp family chromosome partitioning ATPase